MKYITGIYLPPLLKHQRKGLTGKYYYNAERASTVFNRHLNIYSHNKRILGDDFIFYVDCELLDSKDHRHVIDELKKNNISFMESANLCKDNGLFYPKTQIIKQALEELGEPVLWMDFNDCIAKDKLSETEVDFLCEQPIRFECEILILRGKPMHLKDHSVCTNGKQRQPQLGAFFVQDIDCVNHALSLKMPHDQVSFAHTFESKFNIYQDSGMEEILRFSTYGLINSCKQDSDISTYIYKKHIQENKKFEPKIFHKCLEGLRELI